MKDAPDVARVLDLREVFQQDGKARFSDRELMVDDIQGSKAAKPRACYVLFLRCGLMESNEP